MNKLLNLFPNREFIFLDGGFGTMLQKENLDVGRVPEVLNITHPQVVQKNSKGIYRRRCRYNLYLLFFGVNKYKN